MAQLGNIFDEAEAAAGGSTSGPRGRTLRAEVTVPANSLGDPEGFMVEVPLQLPHEGEEVARTPSPFDDGAAMTLRLPESFPSGGTLRLRGQGEQGQGGRAGDLLLTIKIDASNKIAPYLPPGAMAKQGATGPALWIVLAVIAAVAGYLAFGT